MDEVWNTISFDFKENLSARTLYSKMCNPVFWKDLDLYEELLVNEKFKRRETAHNKVYTRKFFRLDPEK